MTLSRKMILLLILSGLAAGSLSAAAGRTPIEAIQEVPGLHRLSVNTPLGNEVFRLEGFRGQEGLSQLFSYELDLVAANSREIPFEALLGKEIQVNLTLPGGPTRHFSGICSSISQGRRDIVTRYRAEMVPRSWLLTLRSRSRIYQEVSVPQIVARVLGEIPGLEYELQLSGNYPKRTYAVQYRETDFDFVSRLLAEEGIFYFFEQTSDGHRMVFADAPQSHPELAEPLMFHSGPVGGIQPGSVWGWERTQELRPGKYTLWDYQFQLPHNSLEGVSAIQPTVQAGQVLHQLSLPENSSLERYDYPGGYATRFDGIDPAGGEQPAELQKIQGDATRTAGLRMQEEAARGLIIQGMSTASGIASGHKFTLGGHFNANGSYVLTSARHSVRAVPGTRLGIYENAFECIPATLPFRPPRTIPKPVIPGSQTALVVGPPGEEIHTDKYGRVKVQFHWDREGERDDRSSCWIRVAALHAGTEQGFVTIPRIGWEVVVSFEEGDPDRPIIIGSVYNPERLPPPDPPDGN